MKHFLRRALALALCVLAVCALLPVTGRADSAYTTIAKRPEKNKKGQDEYVALELPAKNSFFTSKKGGVPMRAEIKSSWADGSIYFMPRPAETYGVLGTVDTGTPVTILAQQNGLYFFMTDDGRMGWNGRVFFTKPVKISDDLSEFVIGSNQLTGEMVVNISKALAGSLHAGAGSPMFYTMRPALILTSGSTATVPIFGLAAGSKYDFELIDGTSTDGEWQGSRFVDQRRDVLFTAKEPGLSVFKFTNKSNKQTFNLLIIVV